MSIKFDGSASYINIGSIVLADDTPWTVIFWVFPINLVNAVYLFYGNEFGAGTKTRFFWISSDSRLIIYNDDGFSAIVPNVPLSPNVWSYIAAVCDGNAASPSIEFYLNAVSQGSSGFSVGSNSGQTIKNLGSISSAPSSNIFDGRLAEFSIWNNKALSGDEIRTYMNRKLTGGEPGLVGYWPISDAGSGASVVIKDHVRDPHNGVMTGFSGNPWRSGPPIILGRAA